MNFELFIAKRIHFSKGDGAKKASSPAIKIAIAGVAIGLAAMILALSIVVGFKSGVRNKVIGFGSHIQITNLANHSTYETHPVCVSPELVTDLQEMQGVKHIQIFATKPGIIKTNDDFQGIVIKGVGKDYDWNFFKQNLVEGTIINPADTTVNNPVIISKNIANKLKLKVGDGYLCYFVEENGNVRYRKFNITGIYSTNFEDYDKLFVITDIDIIRNLNKWAPDEASGVEVLINDFDRLDEVQGEVFLKMVTYRDRNDNTFLARSIKEMNPIIFNWLELLDMNVVVIIVLMFAISIFTMISGLLIIILERTNMIGVLKTLGARDYNVRKVFLYVSSFLIIKGMFIGNVIALAIILIQDKFGIIKLDPATYYVSEMPVDINILHIILLNIGTLILSVLAMVGPSYIIAKISPAKSLRFE
ncbi:MAG: ABC transporter permease [Dysgonomonas sp.]